MEIKQEPLDLFTTSPLVKLEQHMYNTENLQISPIKVFPETKKEPQEIEEISVQTQINIIELKASEIYVKINDLGGIVKEENFSKLKSETGLNTYCDLPDIKTENFECLDQPCSSKIPQKLLKPSEKGAAKKMKYLCPVCQKSHLSSTSRLQHVAGHFARNPVICTCGRMFTTVFQFVKHVYIHNTKKRKTGSKCIKKIFPKSSSSKIVSNQLIHKLPKNNNKKTLSCKVCSKKFNCNFALTIHFRIHTGEKPFGCETCTKQFASNAQLIKHNRIHTGEKRFSCQICSKQFSQSYYALVVHSRIHTGEKPFKCDVCFQRFSVKAHLTTHSILHTGTGEKPFKCEICSKQYSNNSKLRKHFRKHASEKQFECEICRKKFTNKSILNLHSKIHTAVLKPFKCVVCLEQFSNKWILNMHSKIHTADLKPFKCDVCFNRFSCNSHLTRHYKMHTDEAPFKYEICSKQFSDSKDLKKRKELTDKSILNMKSEICTAGKPFKCNICFKEFVEILDLHEHSHVKKKCETCRKLFFRSSHEEPFKCEICLKQSSDSLHENNQCSKEEENQLKCGICFKQFSNKWILNMHSKIHAAAKTV